MTPAEARQIEIAWKKTRAFEMASQLRNYLGALSCEGEACFDEAAQRMGAVVELIRPTADDWPAPVARSVEHLARSSVPVPQHKSLDRETAHALGLAGELYAALYRLCQRPENGQGSCVERAWDLAGEVCWYLDPESPDERRPTSLKS